MSCSWYNDGMRFGYSMSQCVLCNLLFHFIETLFFLSNNEAEYSESHLLAIPHLLINHRPHNLCHTHKHSVCTAAIFWDLWSVSSRFPGERFLQTCKKVGVSYFEKKDPASAVHMIEGSPLPPTVSAVSLLYVLVLCKYIHYSMCVSILHPPPYS